MNNAGVGVMSEAELCPMREFERCMQVNALGMVRVTKTFLPLVRHARGRIINVASLAGELQRQRYTQRKTHRERKP